MANNATVFSGGTLDVNSGGTACDIVVSSGGNLHISIVGVADRTAVNPDGRMILESGGTATNTTVAAGGILKIESGGQLNSVEIQSGGKLFGYFDYGAVTFEAGAVLYFDILGISPDNTGAALVNLTSLPDQDNLPFKLMISDSQEAGNYKLAEGASGFDQTISVVNDVMELGFISTEQSVQINGKEYTLSLNGGDLMLNVNVPTAQYVYLDFDGEGLVSYNNPDLNISFNLSVGVPGFSEEQRTAIVSALSKAYNKDNIVFTLKRPENVDYSTLYLGQSSAFADYGDFFGVAETHDGNNQNKNDNAFVLLDENYSTGQIVSVASHMLDHLLGFSYFVVDGNQDIGKYAENKTLLSYSSDWTQEDPYNKYCLHRPENRGTVHYWLYQ